MADNAIDKLIVETRNAYADVDVIEAEMVEIERQRAAATLRHNDAKKRCDTLDLTMKKHIHENMPVVQAKMVAHEEIERMEASDKSFTISAVSRASAAINHSAQSAQAVNAQLANITKWYAGRNNGSLNLSI